jgi:ubiquinone biosynthesis monooxygenase Coq7
LPGAPARIPWIPPDLLDDVRSDHAGETGAVFIYRGILSVTGDSDLRRFAREHLQTEQHHLSLMDALLPAAQRSRLLPVWRFAGWLIGALPAIFGVCAVYRTIDAVETFVDQHYAEQIAKLQDRPACAELCTLLETCRLDEVAHRDDARSRVHNAPGRVARWWISAVAHGSRLGVVMARRY